MIDSSSSLKGTTVNQMEVPASTASKFITDPIQMLAIRRQMQVQSSRPPVIKSFTPLLSGRKVNCRTVAYILIDFFFYCLALLWLVLPCLALSCLATPHLTAPYFNPRDKYTLLLSTQVLTILFALHFCNLPSMPFHSSTLPPS